MFSSISLVLLFKFYISRLFVCIYTSKIPASFLSPRNEYLVAFLSFIDKFIFLPAIWDTIYNCNCAPRVYPFILRVFSNTLSSSQTISIHLNHSCYIVCVSICQAPSFLPLIFFFPRIYFPGNSHVFLPLQTVFPFKNKFLLAVEH